MVLGISRFEARHQFFKKIARISNNTINIGYTMAKRYSKWWAYFTSGPIYSTQFDDMKNCFQINPSDISNVHLDLLNSGNIDISSVLTSKKISFDGVEFRKDSFLLLGKGDRVDIGQIKHLIISNNELLLVIDKFEATFLEDYGIYKISSEVKQSFVTKAKDLEYPIGHSVYLFQGKLCFALKHIL